MKTDNSIKKIVLAAIARSIMNPESWMYSKIVIDDKTIDFDLEKGELPVFEIKSTVMVTMITTRRIIEKEALNIKCVAFDEIDDVIYGDFKKQIDKPELSKFRIVDLYADTFDFQMETGKASIGLIKAIHTLLKIR